MTKPQPVNIWRHLRDALWPPLDLTWVELNEAQATIYWRRTLTQTILWLMSSVLLVFTSLIVLGLLIGLFEGEAVFIMLVLDVPVWLCAWLARRGAWRPGSLLAPTLMFALGLYGSFFVGMATSFVLFYAIAILLASLLIGARALWLTCLLAWVTHVSVSLARFPENASDALSAAITMAGALLGLGLLLWLSQEQIMRSFNLWRVTAARLHTEIDERRRTEDALRASEEQYRLLADNTSDVIWTSDLNFNMTYVSPAVEKLYGWQLQDWDTIGPTDYMPPASIALAQQSLARSLEAWPEPRPATLELEQYRKDKTSFWVEVSARLLAGADGQPRGVIGVTRDVTERRRVAEALRVSQQLFISLLESLPQNIYSKDIQGRMVFVNQHYCEVAGKPASDIIGKTDWELHPPELAAKYLEDDRMVIETGQTIDVIEEHQPLGRDNFYVQVIKAPLFDAAGQITGTLGIFWDITERVTLQREREALIAELESKNKELERFTYTVSHDLKSPLITVRGFMGFLEKDLESGQTARAMSDLKRIRTAADKMQRLLDELLELSRVGRMMGAPQRVPLEEIVHEAVDLVRGRLEARGVALDIAPNLPVVLVDRLRLLQVLQNLIDNAVKFMGDQPQPQITVGRSGSDRDGKPIVFVRDNGLGIEAAQQARVFDLFEKLETGSEGSGIGLALVKRIVEVHGGRIWLESAGPQHGTTFYFSLPAPE